MSQIPVAIAIQSDESENIRFAENIISISEEVPVNRYMLSVFKRLLCLMVFTLTSIIIISVCIIVLLKISLVD